MSKIENFLTEDGLTVKLFEANVEINSKKHQLSVLIKVFAEFNSIQVIADELQRQWDKFGKFHLTILGSRWCLCSFFTTEAVEEVLSSGPWFVKGHIVGIDKWILKFTTDSLKGLSSPIWVRLPNLPLYCWDEVNVARISSLIGVPILIDGDMIQWGRREFARVCVRIELDKQLPLGVWVDDLHGRFFQKVEYKKVSTIYFNYGKLGHLNKACVLKKTMENVKMIERNPSTSKTQVDDQIISISVEVKYGPWMLVYRKVETVKVKPPQKNVVEVLLKNPANLSYVMIDQNTQEQSRMEVNSTQIV
ncbi:uncharacterized protein LOC110106192 [Dendrobium catenatum]|uniref:uncharacterized protein LOC110106192 n=1 Tax=Dendrobium catenatum TaxID=906689 RepID=UPI0009F1B316|nr:uncharacterized protein LOC110106192 [Dendrobium catenatum]